MAKYHDMFTGEAVENGGGNLAEEFGVPPFSLLDARSGVWQARKAAWLALGIKSEVGRGENLLKFSDTVLQPDKNKRRATPGGGGYAKSSLWKHKTDEGYETKKETSSRLAKTFDTEGSLSTQTGTSIFDPVLCEMFYRWYVPPGGEILDPFAGGSVRGIVASQLGFRYTGIDLRKEQVEANRVQAKTIPSTGPMPKWVCDDARNIDRIRPRNSAQADAIFTCPPYVDLERYSDDPRDISTLAWADFKKPYAQIVDLACNNLRDNRFAGIVVGEVRGKDGSCVGFVPFTIECFEKAGLRLYNDAVLITSVGSLAMRVRKQFENSRKLGRTHQYLLIFVKGDPKKAVKAVEGK